MQVQLAAGFGHKHCACEHTLDMSSLPASLLCMQVCHLKYLSRAPADCQTIAAICIPWWFTVALSPEP